MFRLMANLKSQAIYAALRERILANDIAPGTRLVMRDVANEYDTSDIPVREALRMLERDGLVETTPYRGARVTTLTAKEVEETYFIRSHLESIATGLAASADHRRRARAARRADEPHAGGGRRARRPAASRRSTTCSTARSWPAAATTCCAR